MCGWHEQTINNFFLRNTVCEAMDWISLDQNSDIFGSYSKHDSAASIKGWELQDYLTDF
jgi:hypothetical protein